MSELVAALNACRFDQVGNVVLVDPVLLVRVKEALEGSVPKADLRAAVEAAEANTNRMEEYAVPTLAESINWREHLYPLLEGDDV